MCARCGGGLIRSWGELFCLACGWDNEGPTEEVLALLEREAEQRLGGKSRRREPTFQGQRI